MDEREGKESEFQEGVNVSIDIGQNAFKVVSELADMFGIEPDQVIFFALQEGVSVMMCKPPDYYKLPPNSPEREGKYSEYGLLLDEENLELQNN